MKCLRSRQIKVWYNHFNDGHASVESKPRHQHAINIPKSAINMPGHQHAIGQSSTCPNDQVVAEVNAVGMRDHRVYYPKICERGGRQQFSDAMYMTEDLAGKRVAGKFGPKMLMKEQNKLFLKFHIC